MCCGCGFRLLRVASLSVRRLTACRVLPLFTEVPPAVFSHFSALCSGAVVSPCFVLFSSEQESYPTESCRGFGLV